MYIGTNEGVIKTYVCKRLPADERWDGDRVRDLQGVPHRPNPSRPGLNIPIRIQLPEAIPAVPEAAQQREFQPRRRVITQRELDKYGFTPVRKGCLRTESGRGPRKGHNEECRRKSEEEANKEKIRTGW